ncbi:3-hydroxyacyl-CoA dehydrogenase family protein [Streptomyces sp. NPDC057287]|uniref:3-hydroxyacyl-CoA dehydrogenase family protein n=1 Tax=Streptomyces sp. NPDC057287 TaxID=3346086 RepID=UPI003624EB98
MRGDGWGHAPLHLTAAHKDASERKTPTTTAATAARLHAEYREPLYAAPPLLQRTVDAGRLGRKTGSGLYPYD